MIAAAEPVGPSSCSAPCVKGNVTEADYKEICNRVAALLKGDGKKLIAQLEEGMEIASEGLNFELAAKLRDEEKSLKDEYTKSKTDWENGKDKELLRLLAARKRKSGIIYCSTRKKVESGCNTLLDQGYSATRYHAGLDEEERRNNQEDFSFDVSPIL